MSESKQIGSGILVAALVILGGMWAWPHYHVYQQQLAGEARLREAESSRKILVQEAEAKRDSAKMLAEAEVERAKGVAEANKIIGESLNGHDEYLRYLWIQTLHDSNTQVVYVPTEANLPILEANRGAPSRIAAEP